MDKYKLRDTQKGKGLFARELLRQGEPILFFQGIYVATPTNKTLRIDENLHQIADSGDAAENFINHACEPNGYIGWQDLSYRAKRDIKPGEELSYNYLTSDWDDEDPFTCKCGSSNCFMEIRGFKRLPLDKKIELEPWLSPFLKRKLLEEIESRQLEK